MADRIEEREFGDISENAEYDDVKNEQAMLEKQIADLEERTPERPCDRLEVGRYRRRGVGVIVHVKDQKTEKSKKFKIVGSAEVDPSEREALERVTRGPGSTRPQARRDRDVDGYPVGPRAS